MKLRCFAAAAVLMLTAAEVAASPAVYHVTLSHGPDQPGLGAYTFAGAIAAANADPEPGLIQVAIPWVEVEETLVIDSPVIIEADDAIDAVFIQSFIESGPVLDIRPEAAGSRLNGIHFDNYRQFRGLPWGEPDALHVCAEDISIDQTGFVRYKNALLMGCEQSVSVYMNSADFSSLGENRISGALRPGSVLQMSRVLSSLQGEAISLMADSDVLLQIIDSRFDYFDLQQSVVEAPLIALEGGLTASFENSQFAVRGPVLEARAGAGNGEGQQRPNVSFINSSIHRTTTIADRPLIFFDGDELVFKHSAMVLNSAPVPCIEVSHGSLLLDHSVLAANECLDVELVEGHLEGIYSAIGAVIGDDEELTLDPVSEELLGIVPEFRIVLGVPEPVANSPLRDSGNPLLLAGDEGVPAQDVRGSARITGNAIDIGPVEFNTRPYIDKKSFYRDLGNLLRNADEGELITIYLPDYVGDPDGHEISTINADMYTPSYEGAQPPLPTFDPVTQTISGQAWEFQGNAAWVTVFDELGLGYGAPLEFDKALRQGNSRSSTGGMGLFLVIIAPWFLVRRREVAQ